jgi:hypothetical protein
VKAQAFVIRKPKKSLEYSISFKTFPPFSHYRNSEIHQTLATENQAMQGEKKLPKKELDKRYKRCIMVYVNKKEVKP